MQIKKNGYTAIKANERDTVLKKRFLIKSVVFLFFVIVGIWSLRTLSNLSESKGYLNLYDFVSTVTSNYFKGRKAKPEVISIQIEDKKFKKLEKDRKRALERGVIVNDIDGEFVPAILEYKGEKIKIKLRLKGHMTDHLQEDKWSFRIKVTGQNSFMGMKRFSIQHPGTRGYIAEWIYHKLMSQEDVIALRYKFIEVMVNGRNWGIYAVEENFENELIENNHHMKAPILRFNPDLYWVSRLNELKKTNSFDEYASYYSANPEAYREESVLSDSVQKQYYLKAIALIEGLRSKKITVEQAFEIEKLAKFHAIIDLVGGEHSIDWSDVKYYFDPIKNKLEPVAYESFTDLSSRDLSAFYKYRIIADTKNYSDWHSMIFSDPVFFAAYMKQLERMATPTYLDHFFDSSNKELEQNLAIIYKEFPHKKFEKEAYYKRQAIITQLINPPKAIQAYLDKVNKDSICVQVGAIDALPVSVISITINGINVELSQPTILMAKQQNTYVDFVKVAAPMPANLKFSERLKDSVKINYCILGSSTKMETKVYSFPHTDHEFIKEELAKRQGNINKFPFLDVNKETGIISIKSGKNIIDQDLVIPAGYHVLASAAVSIDIRNHAKWISYSPILFEGTEDTPISITSSDSTSEGIEIINSQKSVLKNVLFKNMPAIHDKQWQRIAAITFYESSVKLTNCQFYNSKAIAAINFIRSNFELIECEFQKMENAINIDYSEGTLSKCVFETCKQNAINAHRSKLQINGVYMNAISKIGLNIQSGTELNGRLLTIKNSNIGLVAQNQCNGVISDLTISDAKIGIAVLGNKNIEETSDVSIFSVSQKNVQQLYLKEKNCSLKINDTPYTEETKEIKKIINDGGNEME